MAVQTQMSRSMIFAVKTAESNFRQCLATGKSSTWLPALPGAGSGTRALLTQDVFGQGIRCNERRKTPDLHLFLLHGAGGARSPGPFAELLLADEVFATELEMKSLSPVLQRSLVFVIFSLRGFTYAPTSLVLVVPYLEIFMINQAFVASEAGWVQKTPPEVVSKYLGLPPESDGVFLIPFFMLLIWAIPAVVSPASALVPVAFDNCVLGGQGTSAASDANESSMQSFEAYRAIFQFEERVAARSADLRTYALARNEDHALELQHLLHVSTGLGRSMLEMLGWAEAFGGELQDLVDFAPGHPFVLTRFLQSSRAEAVGFLLLAPPTFVFTASEDIVLQRNLMTEDLLTGQLNSRPLFLEERPRCEVVVSEWLREGSYYQHQLTIFLPPLVGFRTDLRYRVEVAVRNPPLPLDADLLTRALREKTSPKFSTSPLLAAALNVWRVSTFVWAAGDTGIGDVPFAVGGGKLGGIAKVDEAAWKGFDVLLNT
ncbi:unnamed protein product [Symbiodinium sp. CCMP2456]|nr:unnamed protein product [Symbiodinium sp. CCMP2456]